jgi:hypothetical protein
MTPLRHHRRVKCVHKQNFPWLSTANMSDPGSELTFYKWTRLMIHNVCLTTLCIVFYSVINLIDNVTCRVVRVTRMTGSSSDDWIY